MNGQKNGNRRRGARLVAGIPQPPVYRATSVVKRVFRFLSTTSNTQYAFNVNDLMDLVFFATTATSGFRLASAVKIRKLEAWCSATLNGSPNVDNQQRVSVTYGTTTGSFGAPSITKTEVALGASGVAHFVSVPPRGSLASSWISTAASDTTTLFDLALGQSAVFDMHLTFTIPEGNVGVGENPEPVVRAVAGATAGRIYVSGIPSTAPTLIPDNSTTI